MNPPDPRDLRTVATVGALRAILAVYPADLDLAQCSWSSMRMRLTTIPRRGCICMVRMT